MLFGDFRSLALGLVLCCAIGPLARAESAGRAELDEAILLKMNASTLADLEKVVRLCESAEKKGLEKEDAALAKEILAATVIQRGLVTAKIVQESNVSPALWPQLKEHRDRAIADLERGLKVWPDQVEALFALAQMNLLPEGNRKRAIELAEKTVQLAAEQPTIRAKAMGLIADAEPDAAKRLAQLEKAVALAPDEPGLLFGRGMARAQQKDLKGALADFDKVLELAPKSAGALEAKAVLLAQLKRYDASIAAFDQLRELAPKSPMPMLQEARIYVLQNNLEAALHSLTLALETDPKCVDARLLRAEIWQQRGDKDLARSDVKAALEVQPDNPGAIRLDAALLGGEQKFGDAVKRLEPLAAKDPNDLATLLELAMFLAADHKTDRAIEAYTKAIALQPKNVLCYRNRGDLWLNEGKHAEALADYEKALAIDHKDAPLLNNLAWLLATSPDDKIRNGERAVQLAVDACRLTNYNAAHILSTLAAAHAETGDFKVAIHWAEKAVAAADAEHRASIEKELQSYRDKKPLRERQTPDAPDQAKPKAKP